jgi:Protein of unknown function (DUF2637)
VSSYYDQRRKDKLADREADREDKRLEIEARLKAEELRAEQRRKDAAEKRRLELAERRARQAEKEQKATAAAARRARRIAWLKSHPANVFVAFVMTASIVPAVISQVGALSGAGVPLVLAVLLAAMLEGSAWAVTFMAMQAENEGRPTGRFRSAGWLAAALASAVNLWHGLEEYQAHPWVAFVLAGSSLVAFTVWDLKTHGTHGKSKQEKAAEEAKEKHLSARRKHHKDVYETAQKLLAAVPLGSITDEDAFATAWRIHHGAEPGMSAELYAAATGSRVQLGAAFELGEHVRPELLRAGMLASALNPLPQTMPTLGPVSVLPVSTGSQTAAESGASPQVASQIPPAEKAPAKPALKPVEKAPKSKPVPPRRRKGDSAPFHPAARVAAADTARRSVTANVS